MPRKQPDITRREATAEEKEAIEITLEWLERHVTEDDNGCWVWQGYVTKQGQPQTRVTIAPKVTATMLVRRLVARMVLKVNGRHHGRQAGVLETCSWGCCHPEHVRMRTKVQAMRPRKGKPLALEHRMRISATKTRTSRISDEAIRKMLVDPRPGTVVAKELGVHVTYVPHVRTGKLRAYSAMGGGLFSGLLAPANGAFYDEEEAA